LVDILLQTNHVICDYLKAIWDPELYIDLDDTILHEIRMSDDPKLDNARQLIKRFDSRGQYTFVGEKGLSKAVADEHLNITEEDVIEFAEGDLKVGEISVRKFYINMGMKDQNPMKDVRYYDKKELNQCFTRENYEISLMMPEKYESHVLRMFVKDDKKFQ